MNILDLYISKDGRRLDAATNDRFSSEKNIKDYTVELNFDIANLSYSDEGEYSCVVEGPTRSIHEDANFIVAERLDIQLRIPWWNASMVSCFICHVLAIPTRSWLQQTIPIWFWLLRACVLGVHGNSHECPVGTLC